jgi:hypothetical protein
MILHVAESILFKFPLRSIQISGFPVMYTGKDDHKFLCIYSEEQEDSEKGHTRLWKFSTEFVKWRRSCWDGLRGTLYDHGSYDVDYCWEEKPLA